MEGGVGGGAKREEVGRGGGRRSIDKVKEVVVGGVKISRQRRNFADKGAAGSPVVNQ